MSLPYYLRYPEDFASATFGWPFELKGAYSLVLDLIYARDGKLMDDPHGIAGALGMSVRKWNMLKAKLIEMGKLCVKDGMISNSRADKELIIRRTYRDKQAQNRSRPNKNNGEASPAKSLFISKEEPIGSSNTEKEKKASPSIPKAFRDRCTAAAGACLKAKVGKLAELFALLGEGWTEDEIVHEVGLVGANRPADTIGTWRYFVSALRNRRASVATKPTASGTSDEAMPREQGVIVARWATLKAPGDIPVARINRTTGELVTLGFKPFDGDPPPEVTAALALLEAA